LQQAEAGWQQAAPGAQQLWAFWSAFSLQQSAPVLQQSAPGLQQSAALGSAGMVWAVGVFTGVFWGAGSAKANPVRANTEMSIVFINDVLLDQSMGF
jgi:hypothetical protein